MNKVEWSGWKKWRKRLLLPFICLALDMSYQDMQQYENETK